MAGERHGRSMGTAYYVRIDLTSIALGCIPGFITKGCSIVFELLLEYVCYLSLSPEPFPTQREETVIVPILQKRHRFFHW